MENNRPGKEEADVNRFIRRKTILSFSVFFGVMALAIISWKWLLSQPQDNGALRPLRAVLNANEKVNNVFYSDKREAKVFTKEQAAKEPRVNGDVGLEDDVDLEDWSLTVTPHPEINRDSSFDLTMPDITALPKRDVIFDFKCIEGWSQVTHWGGVRFSDFLAAYHLGTHSGKAPDVHHPEDMYKYVGLITPDSMYYVGIDMKSMMHPQTILCYEINEKPLPMNQGYPLRLIITVKYGIKSLKRIGYLYFSDTRPPDYWFERGYDYDAAL